MTPAATASIWRYLLDVDWTQTVAGRLLAVDHPLLLLLARLNLTRPTISDGLWVRLVDVGAALWASEETIYGRYGYGLASLALELQIPRVQGGFRPDVQTVGRVRLVDAAEAATLMPAVYDAVRGVTPGMF